MFKFFKITVKDTVPHLLLVSNTLTPSFLPLGEAAPKSSFVRVFSYTVTAALTFWVDSKCLPLMTILTLQKNQNSYGARACLSIG